MSDTCVYLGDELAHYNFGPDHPFGPKRYTSFVKEFKRQHLHEKVSVCEAMECTQEQLALFHTQEYLNKVIAMSQHGGGYLDGGDTPAFVGMYEVASTVVGTTLAALKQVVTGHCKRAFIPIAGLHHARRDRAAGFCIFNDCGVAIEAARKIYNVAKIAYVDIDAHHGDGVYYSFESDPDLVFVDFHEDGRYLYPGTGFAYESGKGIAEGTKLNIPMSMGAGDSDFMRAWEKAEIFIRDSQPELIMFQCGADSLDGDPITHLRYSHKAHGFAAQRLCTIADEYCQGRIIAMGGGGYHLDNLAMAWCAVVHAFVEHEGKQT